MTRKTMAFYMPVELKRTLKELAQEKGVSISDFISSIFTRQAYSGVNKIPYIKIRHNVLQIQMWIYVDKNIYIQIKRDSELRDQPMAKYLLSLLMNSLMPEHEDLFFRLP